VSKEEAIHKVKERDWQKVIIEQLRKYYPDVQEIENGLWFPSLKVSIQIPVTFLSKYKEDN